MTDTFHSRPEVSRGALQRPGPEDLSTYGFLPHPEDLRDYRSETYHMVILEKLPAATTNHRFRGVTNHAATPSCLTQTPIYGNEVSQSVRYWECMQTPQLIPPEQSGGVCPCPTRLPSGPNATSEPHARGPFEVVSTESCGYPFPTVFSQHKQPPVPSCDHTICSPPPDVGLLSRRFTENEVWIRARAFAVASLAYRRRGCKSL